MSGFYHIWAWRPYWSCDMDFAIKLEMPLHKDFNLIGQVVSEKKIVDDDEDGRRTTGHGHPISSPCEPSAQVS